MKKILKIFFWTDVSSFMSAFKISIQGRTELRINLQHLFHLLYSTLKIATTAEHHLAFGNFKLRQRRRNTSCVSRFRPQTFLASESIPISLGIRMAHHHHAIRYSASTIHDSSITEKLLTRLTPAVEVHQPQLPWSVYSAGRHDNFFADQTRVSNFVRGFQAFNHSLRL